MFLTCLYLLSHVAQKTSWSNNWAKVRTFPTIKENSGTRQWKGELELAWTHCLSLITGSPCTKVFFEMHFVSDTVVPHPDSPGNVCGSKLNIERALSCPTGGVMISRHNKVRNLLAGLLTDACNNVTNNNCNSTRIQTLWFLNLLIKQVLKCSSSWTQHYLWWK